MEYIEKTLTGIITHGTTSITFTDDFITNDSIIDVYFSSDDIVPTNQEQIGNRLIISIESQTIDISVAVHITNDDTINYSDELESLSDTVENHTSVLSSHGSEIINLRHDVDNIESDIDVINDSILQISDAVDNKQNTLVQGDNIILQPQSDGTTKISATGGGGGSEIYVNQESVIGSYLGKPLYRQVVNVTVSITTSHSQITLCKIENIDALISLRCVTLGRWELEQPVEMGRANDGTIKASFYAGGNRTIKEVIIEYTKSTDEV